jgi:transcriptional regulator with XRE-family HTH domain
VLLRDAVGDTLRKIRMEQGQSMRDVSQYVSLGHLSAIELGTKGVSWEVLASLCEGLNITPADFLMEVANYMKENKDAY